MISHEERLIRTYYEKRVFDAHNLPFDVFKVVWDTMNTRFYYDFLRETPLDKTGWPIVNWIDEPCVVTEK